jgi:hypothetical protein
VVAVTVGVAFLGEAFPPSLVIGGAVIVLGMMLVDGRRPWLSRGPTTTASGPPGVLPGGPTPGRG